MLPLGADQVIVADPFPQVNPVITGASVLTAATCVASLPMKLFT